MDRHQKTFIRFLLDLAHRGLLFLMLFLVPASLVSCSRISGVFDAVSGRTEPQAPEYTVPVVRGDIATSMNFVGNLQYSQSASLTWKTGGVIASVSVKAGDLVRKGDVLAVLEPESLASSVLLAEKTMIEQQERLEDIENSESARMQAYQTLVAKQTALKKAKMEQEALYYPRATRDEMERAWDKYALANLNFNYAKQDYDIMVDNNASWEEGAQPPRTVYFFGRMSVTYGGDDRSSRQRKFEDYVSAYDTLVSAYENYLWVTGEPSATDYAIAEGNVRVARMEYDKALEDYLSYESMPRTKDVSSAEMALNNAETVYNQRYITAPFSGTVTAVDASEGYYVTRGSAAVRVDDMSRIFIPISIPELDLGYVTVGTAVDITVDALSGQKFKGHIYSVAESGTASGSVTSFSAVVEVDDPDERMLAGMTAEISLQLPPRTNVLLIPNAAVSYENGMTYVTVSDGETRYTAAVQLGTVSGNISEVTSGGISEGTQLVVSNVSQNTLAQLGLSQTDLGTPAERDSGQIRQIPTTEALYVRPAADSTAAPAAGSESTEQPAATSAAPSGTNRPTEFPGGGSGFPNGGEMPDGMTFPAPGDSFPGRPGSPRGGETPQSGPTAAAVTEAPALSSTPDAEAERPGRGSGFPGGGQPPEGMTFPTAGAERPDRGSGFPGGGEPPEGMTFPTAGAGRPGGRPGSPAETQTPQDAPTPTRTPVPEDIIPDKG